MTKKEKLISKLMNDGFDSMVKTRNDQTEQLDNYMENGFGDIHPDNIDSIKMGLSYTQGYSIGHITLVEKFNKLTNMSVEEIEELIKQNERITKDNDKHFREVFDQITKKKGEN